jgi:hypothetical protein
MEWQSVRAGIVDTALGRAFSAAPHPLSDRRTHLMLNALRLSILPYTLSRLTLFLVAWAANVLLPYGRPQDPSNPAPAQAWLSWDAVHYLRIARDGYPGSAVASDTSFFPLLPIVLRLLGANPWTAVAFGLAAGLIGVIVLTALTSDLFDDRTAGRTAWVASWWPEAMAWSAVYTEGLFLALAAGAMWAAWARRPWVAAALGLGAGILRPTGLVVALPLLVLLPAGRARLAALTPVVGAAGFSAYLWFHTGQPLAFLKSQAMHHHVQPGAPFFAGLLAGRPTDRAEQVVGLMCLVGVLLLAWRLWRMEQLSEWRLPALLAVVALLMPALVTGTLSSFGRYAMVAFPLFWAVQRMRLGRLAAAGIPAALAFTVVAGTGRLTP